MDNLNLSAMSRQDKIELLTLLEERERRISRRKILSFYPESGPLSRHNYPKHMLFFEAGASYRERCFMAGNRIGKSEGTGCYELACHLTGRYPAWWSGRRFSKPIRAWAAGDTNATVKDILQAKLIGPPREFGTGMILGDCIKEVRRKAGSVPDAVDSVIVTYMSGGQSTLSFKSYEQGREAFQGTEQDVILLDEEPPEDIYVECLTRTMTTNGLIMLTFTPLRGLSGVVKMYMPTGSIDQATTGKFIVSATWDDAPHLSEESKAELRKSYPPHQLNARTKGIPQLGSGAIYPISEDDLLVTDFVLPDYWPRVFAMDFGWNSTAALWRARDPETGIRYYYSEYKAGHSAPAVHAQAIKVRGEWITGVCDPAGEKQIVNQADGKRMLREYQDCGLNLYSADNAREAGIFKVWNLMSTGKLKVFKSLRGWLSEFRIYRRDENGKVVKEDDHLMDCMRYDVMSGDLYESTIPPKLFAMRNEHRKARMGDGYYDPASGSLTLRDLPDEDYNPLKFGLGGKS